MLGTNAEPCTINMMQQEEADFESEDECKIPLIVFSPPNHAQVKEVLKVIDKTFIISAPPPLQKIVLLFKHL